MADMFAVVVGEVERAGVGVADALSSAPLRR
jgi:hypothetical protein